MSEWQPIEAAPKDGARILAFGRDIYGNDYFGVARWAVKYPEFPNSVEGWFWEFATRPTHWTPLPEPPK